MFLSPDTPPRPRFSLANLLKPELLILAVLLGLLCLRVWGLGITHTDDAIWALESWQGVDTPAKWAASQGRLWAYPVGMLISHTLHWQGTLYGELLRLGSFLLFFAAFHWLVRVYCGARLALFCATLFVAFNMVRWDGSILTTYPMLSWAAGIALVAAVLLGRAYVENGKPLAAVASALLLFYALFNNEGMTVLFAWIYLLSIVANYYQLGDTARPVFGRFPRRSAHLFLLLAAASMLYAVLSLVWLKLHPTQYDGHGLAVFSLERIGRTLLHFSTSGSVLHDLAVPYTVTYVDVSAGAGAQSVYRIQSSLNDLRQAPLAVFAGVLVALLVWLNLRRRPQPENPRLFSGAGLLLVVAALSVAILSVLPVTLTGKYQQWAMEQGIKAYSHTMFAHFGWSLLLAAVVLAVVASVRRIAAIRVLLLATLVLVAGALAAMAFRANDRIVDEMRPSAGRWQVLDAALKLNQANYNSPVIWIPRLADGSWYSVVASSYWTDYVKARYASPTVISVAAPDLKDPAQGFVMLGYAFENHGADLFTLAVQIKASADKLSYNAGKIVVQLTRPDAAAMQHYVLAYQDTQGRSVRTPLTGLERLNADGSQRGVSNPQADPATIRLLRVETDGKEVEICATRLSSAFRITQSKNAMPGSSSHHIRRFYLGEGWHPLEQNAVWSKGPRSLASIPGNMLPAGDLRLQLDMSTFTGMGFYTGSQVVRLSVAGQISGEWTYTTGVRHVDVAIDIPAALRKPDGALELQFDVTPTYVPKGLKLSDDDRELGLLLRSVTLQRAAAP